MQAEDRVKESQCLLEAESLQENPSVLQLGGSDTEQVRQAG